MSSSSGVIEWFPAQNLEFTHYSSAFYEFVVEISKFHPETALSDAVTKFEERFRHMEKQIAAGGKTFEKVSSSKRAWG